MKRPLLFIGSLSLALSSGCGDPLKFAQTLEETRALGVRVSGPGGEASLDAGQSAEVELLFAGPGGTESLAVTYRVCPAADSARGVPFCDGDNWQNGTVDWDGTTPISFSVPDDAEQGTRLAFLAAACESGEPRLSDDPLEWSCSDDSEPLRVSFDFWTADDEFQNQNPDLGELSIEIEGETFALEDVGAAAGCDDQSVRVKAEQTVDFFFHFGESAREDVDDEAEPKELLQISHFSTAGQFDRQYTILEAAEEPETVREWKAPDETGPVKIYIVVRDGRGGVTWSSTSVCVE
jgi:hypothetical protein